MWRSIRVVFGVSPIYCYLVVNDVEGNWEVGWGCELQNTTPKKNSFFLVDPHYKISFFYSYTPEHQT